MSHEETANAEENQSSSSGVSLFLKLAVFAFVIISFLNPERIRINGGYGFDGFYLYKSVLMHPGMFFHHQLDSYVIQRSLPFIVMSYVLKALRLSFTDEHVVWAFVFYQGVIVALSIFFWWKTADALALRSNGRWLGVIALIVNYAMLKLNFYNPVLCDSTAILLGQMSFYYYLRSDSLKLLLVSLCTLMVWPTSILFNLILIAFPRKSDTLTALSGKPWHAIVIGISVAALVVFAYIDYSPYQPSSANVVAPIQWLLPVSIGIAVAYVYLILNQLICRTENPIAQIPRALRHMSVSTILCLLALVAAYLLLTKWMASSIPPPFSAGGFFRNFTYSATSRPGLFVPGQLIYWGPFVLLIALRFKTFCRQAASLGSGAFMVTIVTLGLILFSEARALCNAFIFLVTPLAMDLDKLVLKNHFALKFFAISAVCSTVWLPNNSLDPELMEPAETYYMHFGPWMSDSMYLLVSAIGVILTLYFWRELKANTGSNASAHS